MVEQGALINGRYRVIGALGRGGMAEVWEVADTSSEASSHVALKRMTARGSPVDVARATELFEREYHVLSQLTHPRVVAVYDYGRDGAVPFYTMELLDGGDLHGLAPLPFQRACALLRDVCSVLALLHSRRLVYRDLSPRNVRCTGQGVAKLMDFGAMTQMGVTRQLVGTPSFCSPEALDGRLLDARTDLFSLGATLYYTLTAQRAYAARDFRQLREAWKTRPSSPSEHVADIPRALDNLVLELLQLDPAARPASAAEVMERLSAIASLPEDEQLRVCQAYLATPTLVGREGELRRIRRRLRIRSRGRGHAVLVQGAAGMGRSRLLDAAVLEAKLAGGVVLRADAADAQQGDYAVARALGTQLVEALPEPALKAAGDALELLRLVVPALTPERPPAFRDALAQPDLRPRLQAALREWLFALCRTQPLTIAIDEVDRIDEPSAALIALCCLELEPQAMVVICTAAAPLTSPSAALQLLRERSRKLALQPLTGPQTQALLGSIFGDNPNLPLVSQRLYDLSAGNPRDVMRLAQHLVDRGTIRYAAGAWSLPERIDPAELPASMIQARLTRIAALTVPARFLASAMALQPNQPLTYPDCAVITAHANGDRPRKTLDELVAADVLRLAGDRYLLAEDGWVAPLLSGLDPELAKRLHLALAALFGRHGKYLLEAGHLLRGGEHARGLDVLISGQRAFAAIAAAAPIDYVALSGNWRETFELALQLCKQLGRSPLDFHYLCTGLTNRSVITGGLHPRVQGFLSEWLEQLARDAGLDFYARLDPSLPPMAKLGATFEETQRRYLSTPEHERGLDPMSALPALAQAEMKLCAAAAAACEIQFFVSRPSLAPFVSLSPALVVVEKLLSAVHLTLSGRDELALPLYRELLERVSAPGGGGHGEGVVVMLREGMRYTLGLIQTTMGLAAGVELAPQLEASESSAHFGPRLRMLHSLWQCDAEGEKVHSQRVKLVQLQGNPLQGLDHADITGRLLAYVHCEDLTRIKRSIAELEGAAATYPRWQPILGYARAEFARIRGDFSGALREVEAVLERARAGDHRIWPAAAALHVRTLAELERPEQARAAAERYLTDADALQFGHSAIALRMQAAIARARCSDAGAVTDAEAILADLERLGATGLLLGLAHETRARVALHLGDERGFQQAAAQAARHLRVGAHPASSAKHQRLLLEASYRFRGERPPSFVPHPLADSSDHSGGEFDSMMSSHLSAQDRAHLALELLMRRTRATEGFLFSVKDGVLQPLTKLAQHELPHNIAELAQSFIASELAVHSHTSQSAAMSASMAPRSTTAPPAQEDATRMVAAAVDDATVMVDAAPRIHSLTSKWTSQHGRRYRPILLSHSPGGGSEVRVTGFAILVTDAGQPFVHPDRHLTTELSRLALAG